MKETAITLLLVLSIVSIFLHLIFSSIAKFKLRLNKEQLEEIFALANYRGSESFHMRARLFLPWITLYSLSGNPKSIRNIVWIARLSGTFCFGGLAGMALIQALSFFSKA